MGGKCGDKMEIKMEHIRSQHIWGYERARDDTKVDITEGDIIEVRVCIKGVTLLT